MHVKSKVSKSFVHLRLTSFSRFVFANLYHFTLFHFRFTVFATIKMKTFLLFVALICATTTATPNGYGNGEPLSAFLTSLKQALTQAFENLLAMVQRFENEQSTQIDHSSK